MKILFRNPVNQPLIVMNIKGSQDVIKMILGDAFVMAQIREDIVCLCVQNAKEKGAETNFWHDTLGWIYGKVIFCGKKGDKLVALTDNQMEFVKEYIGFPIEGAINDEDKLNIQKDYIYVLYKKAKEKWVKAIKIPNDLSDLQKAVNGYIEVVYMKHNVFCICDEDGRLVKNPEFNFMCEGQPIFGDVLFCSHNDNGDLTSLNKEQFEYVIDELNMTVYIEDNYFLQFIEY